MRKPTDSRSAVRQPGNNEPRAELARDRLTPQPVSASVTVDGRPTSIGALIHDIARLRRSAFDEQAKPLGLTRSHFSVLAHLGRHPDQGMNQSEIAAALEVGKVTLGGLVDRLEASGLVRRELPVEDRRIKLVRLTTKGRRALRSTQQMRPLLDEFVMRDLPANVLSELAGALATMRSNLLAMQRVRRPRPKRS